MIYNFGSLLEKVEIIMQQIVLVSTSQVYSTFETPMVRITGLLYFYHLYFIIRKRWSTFTL
jgi:hypothetical protein